MISPVEVKALLFDLGGVVFEIDFDLAIQRWAMSSRLSAGAIRSRFSMDFAYEQHERGEIGAAEYFAHLRNHLELDASNDEIGASWNAIFVREISESLNDIETARSRIPCYAFTNTNPTHQVAMMAAFPGIAGAFERVFVSSELGLRKPERAAFDAVSAAIGCPSSAVLFFDDTLENVEGALAAGLQAVHVQSPADVRKALTDIEVL